MSRRSRAQAHARRRHVCPRCDKVCFGNGYANHKRACKLHIRYGLDVAWCSAKLKPDQKTLTEAAASDPTARVKDICPGCLDARAKGVPLGGKPLAEVSP